MARTDEELHASRIHELIVPQPLTPGGGNSSTTNIQVLRLILDSGCSHHMVGDARFLSNLRPLPDEKIFRVADGRPLAATMVGDIETERFIIKDVYLVQGLQMDLVSVRQLAKIKIFTTFRENHAVLEQGMEQVGGAVAEGDASLYELRYLNPIGNSAFSTSRAVATGSDYWAAPVIIGNNSSGSTGETTWVLAAAASNYATGNRSLLYDFEVCDLVRQFESSLMCDKWYAVDLPPLTDKFDVSVETGGGACCINKASDGSVLDKVHLGSDGMHEADFMKVQLNEHCLNA